MQFFSDIQDAANVPCCVALGFFDGVHIGHRTLLDSMTGYAEREGLRAAVFTFAQSPAAAMGSKTGSRALMTLNDKLECFEKLGVDVTYGVDFSKYRNIHAVEFVEKVLLGRLRAKAVFCGFNYRFGKNAEGDCRLLESVCSKYGVKVFVTDKVCVEDCTVSSSRIRSLIESGKIMKANSFLYEPFSIIGEVGHGMQNGRTVGVPTLNQKLTEGFVVPRFGAYASFAVINGRRYNAVTNVGLRPTVAGEGVNCETHLLDQIEDDLYGAQLRTQLLWFERDERKFSDLGELAEQIHRDIAHINELDIYKMYINGVYKHGCCRG